MRVHVSVGGHNVSQVIADPTSLNPKEEVNVSQYSTGPIMDDLVSSIGASKVAEKWAKEAGESAEAAKGSAQAAAGSEESARLSEQLASSHATNALLAETEATRQSGFARMSAEYAQNSENIAANYVNAAREYSLASERSSVSSEAHSSRSFSFSVLSELSKVGAQGFASDASDSQKAAKASEDNVKLSEAEVLRIGQVVEGIYEEFRNGASYGGVWNPNTGAYPSKPGVHTIWDVILDEGQIDHIFDGKKWESGDRLIFDSVQDSFFHIQFPAKVVSVNGGTGAVVITPANIGAHPDTWRPTTDDISGTIDFGVIV